MTKRYKTAILALEDEVASASGGLIAVVKTEDYDRLATLARELSMQITHAGLNGFQVHDIAQAILKELGEVPCPPQQS